MIWKTPDQKPEKENHIVLVGAWASCLWYGGEKPEEIFWENVKRWAYLEEIIAQADKAERLQKAIKQELDIYYSPNPSLHPADDCIYAIEKIIGYKRPKENQ